MDRGGRPNLGAAQRGWLQLEADAEQEQVDPEIGEGLDRRGDLVTEGVQPEAGGEVAHERGEADPGRGEPEHEGGDDESEFHTSRSSRISGG